MSRELVGPLLVALTSLPLLIAAVMVGHRRRTGDWDWSSWLTLTAAIAPSAGKMAGEIASPGWRYMSFLTNASVFVQSPWVGTFARIAAVGLAGAGAALLWHRRVGGIRIARPAVVAGALWVVATLTTIANDSASWPRSESLALLALLLLAGTARRPQAVAAGVAVAGVIMAAASAATVFLRPDTALSECRMDKCGPVGWLLNGSLGNENELGLFLAACLPFAVVGVRRRIEWVIPCYLFAMTAFTGSRSASFGAIAIMTLGAWFRPHLGRGQTLKGLGGATAALVAVGLALPYVNQEIGAFSGRGRIWKIGQELLPMSPTWGLGTESWRVHSFDPAAGYSMHNQLLDVRFVGGLVGLMLFLLLLSLMVRWSTERPAMLLIVSTVGTLGLLERPWSVGKLDWLSFSYIAAVAIASASAQIRPTQGSGISRRMSWEYARSGHANGASGMSGV